jgi:rubrerythrin
VEEAMTKDEVIEKLKVGITIEKSALPLYTRHINSQDFLSAFDDFSQKEVQKMLRNLFDESARHKSLLEDLLHKVEMSDNDVF